MLHDPRGESEPAFPAEQQLADACRIHGYQYLLAIGAEMTTGTPRPQRRSRQGSETRQRGKKIDVRSADTEDDVLRRTAAALGEKPAAYLRLSGFKKGAAILAG
jgi:hypothetical protein